MTLVQVASLVNVHSFVDRMTGALLAFFVAALLRGGLFVLGDVPSQ